MRERDIERHLVRRVKEIGGEVRKVQWVGRRGAPDRLVMMPSRKLVTELEGGRKVFRERWPEACLLYTSPSPRDGLLSRMPSSA